MEEELQTIDSIMKEEISKIKEKYNKQKRDIRKKYRDIEKAKHPPKPKRKAIPKAVKDSVWDTTFGASKGIGKCYVCDAEINSKCFDCGHIIAVSNGGNNSKDNLKPICSTCNKSMGTKNMEEFKKEHFTSKTNNFLNNLNINHPNSMFIGGLNRKNNGGFTTGNGGLRFNQSNDPLAGWRLGVNI
jgi:5-methylcytosine-specific restriction endonuclease McrA